VVVFLRSAAQLMTKTGQVVTLKVVKQGAVYHGLAMLLSQNSSAAAAAGREGLY